MQKEEFEGGQAHSSAVLSARCFQSWWAKHCLCPVYDKWRKEQDCIEICVVGARSCEEAPFRALQRLWVNCKERRHFTETEVWPFVLPDPKVLGDTKGDPSTDSAATNACCEWVYLRSSDKKEWPEVLVSSPCFPRDCQGGQPDWGGEMKVLESSS